MGKETGFARMQARDIGLLSAAALPFPDATPVRDVYEAPQRRRWTIRWRKVTGRWQETLVCAILALALGLLITKAVGVTRYDATILRYPFQMDDAEGVILSEATMIAHGVSPYVYQPSPAHHFYAGPYTPVYIAINAVVVWLTGPTFFWGRVVQFLAMVTVAAWIAWAISRSAPGRVGWLVGVWAALLYLTWHLVAHWGVMVRPDMTALTLNLAGATLLRRWWDTPGRAGWRAAAWPRGEVLRTLVLAAACFTLGWLAKQTYVVVPLACFVCMLLPRPKIAVTLAALYAAMVSASLGLLTLWSGGGFFQKIVLFQASWTWDAYLFLARPFAQRYGLLPAIALLAAVGLCIRQRRLTFGACWLALTALKTLTAGTDGGNHNHFIELLAASTLVVGRGVAIGVASAIPGSATTTERDGNAAVPVRRSVPLGIAGLAAILLLTGVAIGERDGKGTWLAWEYRLPTAAERQGFERVLTRIANTTGPIYADNVGLGLLPLAEHTVQVTDPFTLAAEVRLGRWNDTAVVDDVAAGRYRLIALRGDVMKMDPEHPPGDLTPGLVRAIRQHYHLVEHGVVWLYAPNS